MLPVWSEETFRMAAAHAFSIVQKWIVKRIDCRPFNKSKIWTIPTFIYHNKDEKMDTITKQSIVCIGSHKDIVIFEEQEHSFPSAHQSTKNNNWQLYLSARIKEGLTKCISATEHDIAMITDGNLDNTPWLSLGEFELNRVQIEFAWINESKTQMFLASHRCHPMPFPKKVSHNDGSDLLFRILRQRTKNDEKHLCDLLLETAKSLEGCLPNTSRGLRISVMIGDTVLLLTWFIILASCRSYEKKFVKTTPTNRYNAFIKYSQAWPKDEDSALVYVETIRHAYFALMQIAD